MGSAERNLAEEVLRGRTVDERRPRPSEARPVAVGDRLFGVMHGLHCLDLSAGLKVLWTGKDSSLFEHASLIASPTHVLIVTSEAELILLDAQANAMKFLGRQKVLPGESGLLSHPAIVGSRLYLRGSGEIVCLELDAAGGRAKKD